jgi:hypothetical protein
MPSRGSKKKKRDEEAFDLGLVIKGNSKTGQTEVHLPSNLAIALKLLNAAIGVLADQLAANQRAALEAASKPKVKLAGANQLRALPPHNGNGRG